MIKLLIIPLIPIFVMLLRAHLQEKAEDRRHKRDDRPRERKALKPKEYNHEWEDDE